MVNKKYKYIFIFLILYSLFISSRVILLTYPSLGEFCLTSIGMEYRKDKSKALPFYKFHFVSDEAFDREYGLYVDILGIDYFFDPERAEKLINEPIQ